MVVVVVVTIMQEYSEIYEMIRKGKYSALLESTLSTFFSDIPIEKIGVELSRLVNFS